MIDNNQIDLRVIRSLFKTVNSISMYCNFITVIAKFKLPLPHVKIIIIFLIFQVIIGSSTHDLAIDLTFKEAVTKFKFEM